MKYLCLLCLVISLPAAAAQPKAAASAPSDGDSASAIAAQLDEVARVGSVMTDGDVCKRIVTERAQKYMFTVDPRDRWLSGDNYDVNDDAFIPVKKTLIRLSHLTELPNDVNLWMPIEDHPDKIRVVIRNVHEMSQFWPWGALYQDMIPQMKTVLETGKRVTVTDKPGWVSVLAPVSDSMGDVVGVLEVVTQIKVDAQDNVK
jgi:hypothetical protein